MRELVVATGEQLVGLTAHDGFWQATRLTSGRGMQCLAADPANGDTLYAGSRGEGVWKSTKANAGDGSRAACGGWRDCIRRRKFG